ncbi:MAG: DUF3052 domain-containing protein [Actinomycetaceae bacterium]|nr:DUF3052 domain-containing protein [Actinomycetaceae bacterium]MDU0970160.1 DUF3052 domain-containing protein [Actinomycetaceae bacterium]
MASSNERQSVSAAANPLGFGSGQVVQEFGWDEDVDEDLRDAVMNDTQEDLEDEDYTNVADGALVWWRDDDGDGDDLADLLMDAIGNLDDGGVIWVLTPKASRGDHVDSRTIEQAAKTAGLNPTSTAVVGPEWAGTRIVSKAKR